MIEFINMTIIFIIIFVTIILNKRINLIHERIELILKQNALKGTWIKDKQND